MAKIALLSTYNKEGIADFAKELIDLGWNIVASAGTAKVLADAGVEVRDVEGVLEGNLDEFINAEKHLS